jgi:hypothetical protein
MATQLYPKNFLTIQVPPILQVSQRHDGALVIYPPVGDADPSTMTAADTSGYTESTSDTATHAGTSTEGETWTRTNKIATVLQSGREGYPVVAAGFAGVRPTSYDEHPDVSQESFEVASPLPQAQRNTEGDVHPTGELKLTNFTVDNLQVPSPEQTQPTFVFPDVSPPWEGSVAAQFDRDDDNPGDPDDTQDTDDDNDSDEGPDEQRSSDTMDVPGGLPELMKRIHVTPPFASQGTTGQIRRTD